MLLGIMIGALAWQLVTVFAYLLSKEDEDIAAIWGMGFWRLLIYGCSIPLYYFSEWVKTKRYVAMMIDIDGNPCYCKSEDEPDILMNIGYKFNTVLRDKYTQQNGWKKDHMVCGIVNVRYTPIKIAKIERAYKIGKEIIREAQKNSQ